MSETLPDCPDGWIVNTSQPVHLSLYYRGDGRSLVVRPTDPAAAPIDPEAVEVWTVKGLAGYGPRYPIFAEAVTRDEAVATAESVMAAIAVDDDPSPVRYSDRRGSEPTESSATNADDDDNKTADQAALTAFADDSDGSDR